MSRIDALLREYCPTGVKYSTIADALTVVATPRGVKRGDYASGAKIAIVDQGQKSIAGYTDDDSLLVPHGDYVVFGDHTRAVKWVDFPFAVGADGTKVLRANSGLLPKFAYYLLENLDIPDRGYNRHWTIVRELRIPVPPLEMQREIVRVLDQFTQLSAELQAELEAELKFRRLQYEHYQSAVLDVAAAVERFPMGSVATVGTGKTDRKDAADGGEFPLYVRSRNVMFSNTWEFDESAIIIPGEGGIGEIFHYAEGKYALHQRAYRVCPIDNRVYPKYLYHYLRKHFGAFVRSRAVTATVTSLRKPMLTNFPVPLIPLAEQRRIANVLDKLDALIIDLSTGLPAEVAARRKQYEYYRDKLLTFEEAAA